MTTQPVQNVSRSPLVCMALGAGLGALALTALALFRQSNFLTTPSVRLLSGLSGGLALVSGVAFCRLSSTPVRMARPDPDPREIAALKATARGAMEARRPAEEAKREVAKLFIEGGVTPGQIALVRGLDRGAHWHAADLLTYKNGHRDENNYRTRLENTQAELDRWIDHAQDGPENGFKADIRCVCVHIVLGNPSLNWDRVTDQPLRAVLTALFPPVAAGAASQTAASAAAAAEQARQAALADDGDLGGLFGAGDDWVTVRRPSAADASAASSGGAAATERLVVYGSAARLVRSEEEGYWSFIADLMGTLVQQGRDASGHLRSLPQEMHLRMAQGLLQNMGRLQGKSLEPADLQTELDWVISELNSGTPSLVSHWNDKRYACAVLQLADPSLSHSELTDQMTLYGLERLSYVAEVAPERAAASAASASSLGAGGTSSGEQVTAVTRPLSGDDLFAPAPGAAFADLSWFGDFDFGAFTVGGAAGGSARMPTAPAWMAGSGVLSSAVTAALPATAAAAGEFDDLPELIEEDDAAEDSSTASQSGSDPLATAASASALSSAASAAS
jgi:hypothetical protein